MRYSAFSTRKRLPQWLRAIDNMKIGEHFGLVAVGIFAVIAGAGEIIVGFTGNYLGILAHSMTPALATVMVGAFYGLGGLCILTLRKWGAALGVAFIGAEIAGRVYLVASGMAPSTGADAIKIIIGGLIAGIPRIWEPTRLAYLSVVIAVASLAMISLMFLVMVRVDDPLVPRAIFGVLNMLLFFPSGAVYPIEAFPAWLRWISVIDPFTYTVHALRNLTLKDTGLTGIYMDILILSGFSAIMMAGSVALFKRQL